MASLVRYGRGKRASYRVDFSVGGKRKAIRLGKIGHDEARTFKVNLELLLGSKVTNTRPADDILRWLAGLSDKIHERLSRFELTDARKPASAAPTLRAWVDRFLAQRPDLKPASVRSLRGTGSLLIEHLGGDVAIDSITADAAAGWRSWLVARPIQEPLKNERTRRVQAAETDTPPRIMAEASIRLHCRNAKGILNEAVKRELIAKNPFRNLTSTAIAADRDRYIIPEETDKTLEHCPDVRWRLLVGLARLAGLRVPSETHSLTWGDVDFDRWRLTVRSVKTERFAGKETRIVPIVPKLQAILQDAFDKAEPGQERVVTLSRNNLHRTIRAAVKRAGLLPWADLFQAMRRSCETEWSLTYPAHVCAAWLGHSEAVSRKHYLQVPEDLYDQVTKSQMLPPEKSAAECAAADTGTERPGAEVPDGEGIEKIAESPENTDLSRVFGNAPCRTRTCNPLIKSQQSPTPETKPKPKSQQVIAKNGKTVGGPGAAKCAAELGLEIREAVRIGQDRLSLEERQKMEARAIATGKAAILVAGMGLELLQALAGSAELTLEPAERTPGSADMLPQLGAGWSLEETLRSGLIGRVLVALYYAPVSWVEVFVERAKMWREDWVDDEDDDQAATSLRDDEQDEPGAADDDEGNLSLRGDDQADARLQGPGAGGVAQHGRPG